MNGWSLTRALRLRWLVGKMVALHAQAVSRIDDDFDWQMYTIQDVLVLLYEKATMHRF